jgi:hypothetical protein
MTHKPKAGTVVEKEGNFFLEAEGKLTPIPVSPHFQPGTLKELVGKKVEVLYTEPRSFVAGLVGGRVPILCYFPVDPWFSVVDEKARLTVAQQFLNEGLLSKETFEKITGGQQ